MNFFAYYMGPSQVSFFAYYMGPPSGQFLRLLCGVPLDKLLCILYGGPGPQVSFFAYYRGPPQISFFAYYMGAPLRSVSLLTKWGPSVQFLRLIFSILKKMYALSYPWGGGPIFLNFQGGQVPPLATPCGRP